MSAPVEVAMQRVVDRINAGSGGDYTLQQAATFTYQINEDLKDLAVLAVTVTPDDSQEEVEGCLDYDNFSSHSLRVSFRKKLADKNNATIGALCLLVSQVANFLDQRQSDTAAVSLMEVSVDQAGTPDKSILLGSGVFAGSILVRAEVES